MYKQEYSFYNLDRKTLEKALQEYHRQIDLDTATKMFYNKENFDAGKPRIVSRKERRKMKAINRKRTKQCVRKK